MSLFFGAVVAAALFVIAIDVAMDLFGRIAR